MESYLGILGMVRRKNGGTDKCLLSCGKYLFLFPTLP